MNESWNKSLRCGTQPGTFSGPKKPLGDACLVGTSLSPVLPKILAAPMGFAHFATNWVENTGASVMESMTS